MNKKIIGSSIASSACSASGSSKNLKAWRKAIKRYRNDLRKDLNILLERKKKDMELIYLLLVEIVKINKQLKRC